MGKCLTTLMNAVQFVHRGHGEKFVSSFGAHSQRPGKTTRSDAVSNIKKLMQYIMKGNTDAMANTGTTIYFLSGK